MKLAKTTNITPEISKYMSDLAKLSHKKHPRTKEYFSKLGKIPKKPRKEKEKSFP